MCRMTDNHIRAHPTIMFPGRHYVAKARHGNTVYLAGSGPVDITAFKVLYVVNVKAKETNSFRHNIQDVERRRMGYTNWDWDTTPRP